MNSSGLALALDIAIPAAMAVGLALATRSIIRSYERKKSIWKGLGATATAILAFIFGINTVFLLTDLRDTQAAPSSTTDAAIQLGDAEVVWCASPEGTARKWLTAEALGIVDLPADVHGALLSMASTGEGTFTDELLLHLLEAVASSGVRADDPQYDRACRAAYEAR